MPILSRTAHGPPLLRRANRLPRFIHTVRKEPLYWRTPATIELSRVVGAIRLHAPRKPQMVSFMGDYGFLLVLVPPRPKPEPRIPHDADYFLLAAKLTTHLFYLTFSYVSFILLYVNLVLLFFHCFDALGVPRLPTHPPHFNG